MWETETYVVAEQRRQSGAALAGCGSKCDTRLTPVFVVCRCCTRPVNPGRAGRSEGMTNRASDTSWGYDRNIPLLEATLATLAADLGDGGEDHWSVSSLWPGLSCRGCSTSCHPSLEAALALLPACTLVLVSASTSRGHSERLLVSRTLSQGLMGIAANYCHHLTDCSFDNNVHRPHTLSITTISEI